ncbi:unnamed protein product [Penicillium salamii]|nr:unnamed protein product [Penicillium salamii]
MSVRKAHNSGRNHLRNVVDYYQQIGQEKAQSVIDSITSSYAAEGQQVPNMMPPGAFPPPFGGFPGRPGMPPPPFGIPPPGAPGAPAMIPRMSLPIPPQIPGSQILPYGHLPANYAWFQAPGSHGLPFPPPFNAGTPPTGGFPPPLPNMPQGAIPLQAQAASLTFLSPRLVDSHPCPRVWPLAQVVLFPVALRLSLLVPAAWRRILLPLGADLPRDGSTVVSSCVTDTFDCDVMHQCTRTWTCTRGSFFYF